MDTIVSDHVLSIGAILQKALVFNFQNWRGRPMNTESISQAVINLFALLEQRQVSYVLVGGIALLQYIEGRNTEDIDLILAAKDLEVLPEIQIVSQDNNFARGNYHGLQIDFLLTRNALFEKVRQHHATRQTFVEQEIVCATVEGLLLLKLYALPSLYRQGNFARVGLYENDIATLMQVYRPQTETLLTTLAPHLSENDLTSLRDIVGEIQARIQRFEKRS